MPTSSSSPAADAAARWHQLNTAEIVKLLESDCQQGLTDAVVLRRQQEYGLNVVSARGGTPAWKRFLQQFNQPLVYLLIGASLVTGFLHEWVDSSVIFGVVFINAIIGFFQESKAEKAVEELSTMVITEATVRRAGRRQRVPSAQLVPGDVACQRTCGFSRSTACKWMNHPSLAKASRSTNMSMPSPMMWCWPTARTKPSQAPP